MNVAAGAAGSASGVLLTKSSDNHKTGTQYDLYHIVKCNNLLSDYFKQCLNDHNTESCINLKSLITNECI